MIKNYKRGFTLIELLVVIAIIGILAAIVLASVSSARGKGADAAIQGDMHDIQTEAEIYASGNSNSYTSLCTGDTTVTNALANIATLNGGATATCTVTSATVYAVAVWLHAGSAGAKAWCVDSTGNVKGETTVTLSAGGLCP